MDGAGCSGRWRSLMLSLFLSLPHNFQATQLPKGTGYRLNTTIVNVYKNMAALLIRSSLLSAYAAAFMVLLSFVAMYSGLGGYLENKYDIDQNGLFLIRLAGIPGMLLSPLFGKFIQKWAEVG